MGDSFTKVNEIISPEKLILLRKKNFEKKNFQNFFKIFNCGSGSGGGGGSGGGSGIGVLT